MAQSNDDADDSSEGFEAPRPTDGFDEPSKNVQRRNLITAGIIVAILLAWILFGLRGPLFGLSP